MKQSKSEPENSQQNHSKNSSETFDIITTPNFVKEAQELKKKFPNISDDFYELHKRLKADPITGNDHVEKDLWKVRMAISDKNKGERSGARVIIEVKVIDKVVYVLSVYDKSEIGNLTDEEYEELMKMEKPIIKRRSEQKRPNYRYRRK